MTATLNTPQRILTDVSDGYAVVNRRGRSGRPFPVGTVSRDKFGSTRTGTRWTAKLRDGYTIGTADTRAGAVELFAAGLFR